MVDQAKISELEGEMEDFDPESGGESWNPEESGEYITGEVLSFQTNVGQYDSNLMTLDTADGEIGVWVKKVLKSSINRMNIKPGDLIGIKYAGEKETKKGPSPTRTTGSRF